MLIGVHKLKCLSTNFYPFCILVVRQIRKSPLINQILQSDGNNCRLHDWGELNKENTGCICGKTTLIGWPLN